MSNKIKPMLSGSQKNKPNIIIVFIVIALSIYGCKSDGRSAAIQSGPSFDSLRAIHDSLVAQYNAANSRVDELSTRSAALDSQVTFKDAQIARLENELKHLGGKNKILSKKLKKDESFIASIKDELNEKERSFAQQLGILKSDKETLTQKLNDLMSKFTALKELGSVLHASNIRVAALHLKHNGKKEKETKKARKLNVLRVYFDIDENRIAENGTKKLYIAVTAPDGKVLSGGNNNSGTIPGSNGQVIKYSVLKEVSLKQNEPVKDISVDWKEGAEHEKGTYNVAIYNGGYNIGGGSVALK